MITSGHKSTVCGEISVLELGYHTDSNVDVRGWSWETDGGAMGIFVGASPTGREWFAYHPCEFLALCDEFDHKYGRVVSLHT